MSKRRRKNKNGRQYYKQHLDRFGKFVLENEGMIDTSNTAETEFIFGGETYRQCYSRTKAERKRLPVYWFVSRPSGNIFTTSGKKIKQLSKGKTDRGYEYVNYSIGKRSRYIGVHDLCAIVFESTAFGKAKELLKKKSIDAFGRSNLPDNLQGHHEMPISACRDTPNDPGNIGVVTIRAHNIAGMIPAESASDIEHREFMEKLSKLADIEAPGKVVIAANIDGAKSLRDTKGFLCSENFLAQLKSISRGLAKYCEQQDRVATEG